MGRTANDTYDEFKEIYLTHPKGIGERNWTEISTNNLH